MGVQNSWCLIFALLMLLNSSQEFKFDVGGRDGWVLKPTESYNHWAERNRFQVNDTLLFKFKKGNDSVLLVIRDNYNECKVRNPIKSLTEGESIFKFERSGPYYFISGNEDHCKKGQKLFVIVLAIRPKKSPPVPAPMLSPPTASPAPPALSPPPSETGPTADVPTPNTNSTSSLAISITTLSPSVVLTVAIGVCMFFG